MIDIGVNLASKRLHSRAAELVSAAEAVGVHTQIITGSDEESNQSALSLAHQFPRLYATAGFHPHHANEFQPKHRLLIQSLARDERCVAVGEMGLDYVRNYATPANQRACFESQLLIAKDVQKPVFLHERGAYDDFAPLLQSALPELSGAVWHCFTGTRAQMEEMADLGVYFGITGWLCDPERGKDLRETVKHIPRNRLMIETDAPYLSPKTLRPVPSVNEPKYLPEVLRVLSECLQTNPQLLEAQLDENTYRFFNIKP